MLRKPAGHKVEVPSALQTQFPLSADEVADRVKGMKVYSYKYLPEIDAEQSIFVGPMAQDFYQAFPFGRPEGAIYYQDSIAVLTLALQSALRRIDKLEEELGQRK